MAVREVLELGHILKRKDPSAPCQHLLLRPDGQGGRQIYNITHDSPGYYGDIEKDWYILGNYKDFPGLVSEKIYNYYTVP